MRICVGAVSRRVVEEAARLQVAQIVASRRQVDTTRSYIGYNQRQLVELVKRASRGETKVVRDHGGPNQGWGADDGIESLKNDVEAGFHGLHLDVCKLPRSRQLETLQDLVRQFAGKSSYWVEVGGEHEPWEWNIELYSAARHSTGAPSTIKTIVLDTGTFAWADRQCGAVRNKGRWAVQNQRAWAEKYGLQTKAHNCDWLHRTNLHIADFYNLAPELAQVEINALLTVLVPWKALELLELGYNSREWERWFKTGEGTHLERAKCGARYILNNFADGLNSEDEQRVRAAIVDVIERG